MSLIVKKHKYVKHVNNTTSKHLIKRSENMPRDT